MLENEYRLEIQFKKVQKIRNINNIPTVGSRPSECKPAQHVLANRINNFFTGLTDHFEPLTPRIVSHEVPQDFFVTENEVYRALSLLQVNKSVGPDYIPNRVLKEFAYELAPIIKDIYNQSMKEGYIPELLKSSIVIPVPKINPPRTIENDLRPISLTCTIAKVMEGFTCTRLLPQ